LYQKINPNAAHTHLSFHKISRFSLVRARTCRVSTRRPLPRSALSLRISWRV
jgi:hypothetical protein